jgi:hypothetical protein
MSQSDFLSLAICGTKRTNGVYAIYAGNRSAVLEQAMIEDESDWNDPINFIPGDVYSIIAAESTENLVATIPMDPDYGHRRTYSSLHDA